MATRRWTEVMDWNNKRKVGSGCKANTCNLRSSRFNIDRKDFTAANVRMDEGPYVIEVGLGPDFTRWAANVWEVFLAVDLGQVCDGGWSEFPLARDSSRMVSA